MGCSKKKIWDLKDRDYSNTQIWGAMDVDWENEHKLNSVFFYFFRFDNYQKGLENNHIMLSTFGIKSNIQILEEIEWWFNVCIGVYSDVEFN